MITKRIIPCLDVRSGRVVKGTNFEGIRDVADPVEMARMYNAAGADELVFYDITASFEGRTLFTDILTRVASEVFIPLTVGGGINTLEDFDRVLKCGADKVSVNSGALRDPDLIPAAARRYGNQCATCAQSDRAERAGGRALRNGTCRNRAFADLTVKRNGVYCSPFAGNGWDQPAEIVYGFVDRSRTGYEYCEK